MCNIQDIPRHPFEALDWPTLDDRRTNALLSEKNVFVRWLGEQIPLRDFPLHSLILGMTGSGKSNLIKMFLQSLLPVLDHSRGERRVGQLEDRPFPLRYRAIITDPQRDYVPFFHRMGFSHDGRNNGHVIITNPFDTRCCAWDIAGDLLYPAHLDAFAEALCPMPPEGQYDNKNKAFWDKVANTIVRRIVQSLNKLAPKNWDLRDVVTAATHRDYLKQILSVSSPGRETWKANFEASKELAGNVWITVSSNFGHLETTSQLWHQAKSRFSMATWLDKGGLLLLAVPAGTPEAVQPLNKLLGRFAFQSCLNRDEEFRPDMSWFILDELSTVGDFPKLLHGLKLGRKRGVRIILADQDKSSLNRVFGKEDTAALYGQCGTKVFLRMNQSWEAEEAAKEFGLAKQDSNSRTQQPDGSVSHTVGENRDYLIDPRKFNSLQVADELPDEGGFEAYGIYKGEIDLNPIHMTGSEVTAAMPMLKKHFPDIPKGWTQHSIENVPEYQSWNDEDLVRLGLKTKKTSVSVRWSNYNPIDINGEGE